MEIKSMEKKYFSLKQYDKAEICKIKGDALEAEERKTQEMAIIEKVEKAEQKLR